MRNKLKFLATRIAAVPAVLTVAATSAFAQTSGPTPTTAVELAQSVDLSDAKAGALVIVGMMIAAGVTLWGARLIMSKFKPKV